MSEILGFQKNKKYFKNLIAKGGLSHAYLFSGQEMIGKKTFALALAKQLNGFAGDRRNDPDLFFLDTQTKMGIEQIRDLKSFLSLKPYAGKYRVAIIDDAHNLGVEAANALLKALEEPPASSLLMLVTAYPKALLPTIASRMVEIRFAPHSREDMLGHLSVLGLTVAQAEFLADFANGQLGLAYRLKERNAFKNIRQDLEEFNRLLAGPVHDRLAFAEKLFAKDAEADPRTLVLNWLFYLRSDFSKKLKVNRTSLLKRLLTVNNLLTKPQYNHRLIFENLLLSL